MMHHRRVHPSRLPELFTALPDQVTTERLTEARLFLAKICEVDARSVSDSHTLAGRLQGVSRAVSDIVVSKGAVEVEDLRLLPSWEPGLPARSFQNVLSHTSRTATGAVRIYEALPAKCGEGASIHTYEDEGFGYAFAQELYPPTDRQIDGLLTGEPALWSEAGLRARDFDDREHGTAHPFHNTYYDDGAPQRYFGILQQLGGELLKITA